MPLKHGRQTVKSERDRKQRGKWVLENAKVGHSRGNSKLYFAKYMEATIFLKSTSLIKKKQPLVNSEQVPKQIKKHCLNKRKKKPGKEQPWPARFEW